MTLLPAADSLSQDMMREEIVVGFEIPRLLKKDIFVQYDGADIYVPLIEVFSELEFQVQANLADERIVGHLASESEKFVIDLTRFHVKAPGGERDLLRSDYYYDGRDFYLRIDLYGELFNLYMKFDFSMLRVLLPLSSDFPAYQKLERRKARAKLTTTQKALRDVRRLPRSRSFVEGGALDWSLSTAPIGGGAQYYNLDLGAMVLGGDLMVSGGGNSRTGFQSDQLDYLWHYYFERGKYVTQAEVGRFYSTGVLGRGFTGARITNRPQVKRKYFQTVQISDHVGTGYEVELYIDGKLTDYQTTDASGRYDFNVDVFYGASNVEVKLYGPNGELETVQQHFRIPFNLMPVGELEYSLAVGEGSGEGEGRMFAQGGVYYGVGSWISAGGGVDVPMAAIEGETPLYSFETTLQPATNLTVNASVAPSNRMTGDINFTWPSVITLGAHVSSFYENAFTNPIQQKYRWRLSASTPLRLGGRYLGLRFNISRDEFENFGSTNLTYGFNTSVKPINMNYVGQYKVSTAGIQESTELSSKIMGSIEFHRRFRPQFRVDYDPSLNQLTRYSVMLTRRLFRSAQMSFTYERNPLAGINSFMVTFNLFTGFFDYSSRTQKMGDRITMSQQQRGSVRFDASHNRFLFDRRKGVGYGSAVVKPFLDENFNGLKDPSEIEVSGVKAKISGISGPPRGGDRTYYYDRLRPYDEYLVQIDQYSLDDPTLKPSNENYRITLNPSVVTAIEVPIVTASEISGSVKRQIGEGSAGIGGIRVMVFNISKDVLTEITTFNDGEYYFLGLLPGTYRAYIDPEQIGRAGYRSQPESVEFDVKPIVGGEVIENVSFVLMPK